MNVLVTGVGAIIGYGIIESLRLSKYKCFIVGIDIFEENYGKYVSDAFVQVPYTSDPSYPAIIREIIDKYDIDLVFPGIEQDMLFYALNQTDFNVPIILNKKELVELSQDKLLMYNYLDGLGFNYLIPTKFDLSFDEAKDELGLPFIIKPRKSYASKGYFVISGKEDFEKHSEWINENTIYQPYVGSADDEYTASIFGDSCGGFFDSLVFRRYLSKEGASEKVIICELDIKTIEFFSSIASIFKPIGPTNIQYRIEKDRIYLLEINPRISSSCSLRTKFGYNEPEICIDFYIKGERDILPKVKSKGRAIRYIADKLSYE
jgi:carbamoyl-phosphate synthase large subunit